MFKKLFKPKWMHAQPEIRKMAVASLKLNKPEHRQALENLALSDEDDTVRLAAAERLEGIDDLLKAYVAGHSEALRIALAELLIKRTLENISQWQKYQPVLDQIKEQDAFKHFIAAENGESFAVYALARVPDDQEFLAQIAQDFALRAVRQQAAERLSEQDKLRVVLETAKSKDKTVYRIVKQKLDALRKIEREQADQRAEVERVLTELKRLAQLDPDPLLPHKVKQLSSCWAAIDIDVSTWQPEYDALITALNAKDEAFKADQDRQKEMAKSQAAAQDSFVQICQALEEALEVISSESSLKAIDLDSLQQVLEAQQGQWGAAAAMAAPSAEKRGRYQKLTQEVQAYCDAITLLRSAEGKITEAIESMADANPTHRERIEKNLKYFRSLLNQIQWPLAPKRPSILMHLEASIKQAELLLSDSKQAIANLDSRIRKQMKALRQAIDDGLLKEGQAALKQIHALMRDLPMRVSESYQKDLRTLMQSLNELRDWQGFATIPKKQALLEKMQALAEEEDLPPQVRADRVKELQQAWRDLGTIHSREEKALWAEFKAAGEKAFEPCKAYFEAQQQQREQNLANREAILIELETYLAEHDWEKAQWPMVLETLKAARTHWRAATPVDRRHHQRTQRRFDKVVGEIQSKVDAERERNAQKKSQLVEQATELLDSEDLDAAIETMKGLQSAWKQVGIMKKSTEQSLWAEFQKAADALFGQRKRRREDQDQERADNKQRVEALTQSVLELAEQAPRALLDQQAQVTAWAGEFEQLAPLPRAEAKALRQKFKSAHSQYQKALTRAQAAEAALAFEQLNQANQYLDRFERALSLGDAGTAQLTQLKEAWQRIQQLPPGSEVGVNTRFDEAVAAFDASEGGRYSLSAEELEKLQHNLHETVLQLEILLGVDSPAEDQNQRMSLQVSRLSEKLGGKTDPVNDAEQAIQSLVIKWCVTSKLGAWPDVERLDARYQQAVKKWLNRSLPDATLTPEVKEASTA